MCFDIRLLRKQRIVIINIIVNLHITLAHEEHNSTRTDFEKCKLSQLGSEYRGTVSRTVGGMPCQAWYSERPLHKVSENIKDEDFPEKSVRMAKNYCRNPTRDRRGPWCYTLEPSLIDDECEVPLCNFEECRLSGPGAEYGGSKTVTTSGKKCKHWHRKHKLRDSKSIEFKDKNFPRNSRRKASNFCRNPDGDVGGPWCYVESEDFEYVEKEYCDVPFCDDRDCLSYTRTSGTYSILSKFDASEGNTTFSIKLWDPTKESEGEARIFLSVLPNPWIPQDLIQKWRAGVEIILTNFGVRINHARTNEEEYFDIDKEFLSGSKWTGVWVNWGGGFISIGLVGTFKPLLIQQYQKKKSILSLHPEIFLYYGLLGTGVLWSTQFCQTHCEVHTTFGTTFSRVWSMQRNNDTLDVQMSVRASRDVFVRLYRSPALMFPSVTLKIGRETISLGYQENRDTANRYLKEIPSRGLLDFWAWKEFSVSIFGPHLRLFSKQVYGKAEILYVRDDVFSGLRWFSVASENTIAKWAFFCSPKEESPVEGPWPPNCISDSKGFEYQGVQWTATNEAPCVPWISNEIPKKEQVDDKFMENSTLAAVNMCRNPNRDPNGPYCYAIASSDHLKAINITKSYCPIRTCRSSECKMAGTANDYIGTLSVTRSGRTCKEWFATNDYDDTISKIKQAGPLREKNPIKSHKTNQSEVFKRFAFMEDEEISNTTDVDVENDRKSVSIDDGNMETSPFDDSSFPEGSACNASNYCRNPSREIGGAWCYTDDFLLEYDLCDVRDCEKPEEYTILVIGNGRDRKVYILPEYRSEGLRFSVKIWEPDQPDSITFVFTGGENERSRYILKIGELDNEKVLLYHESERKVISLLKKKSLPHLLYLGKWSSFVLRLPRGRVLLFYEGAPEPIFEWSYPNTTDAFLPIYYYYGSEQGHAMALAFESDSGCHIENTKTNRYTKVLSVRAWKKGGKSNKLTILLRGKGSILIPLFLLPTNPGYYVVNLNQLMRRVTFTRNTSPKMTVYHKERVKKSLFKSDSWTNVTLEWTESTIDIWCNESRVLTYTHPQPLVFYYFSIGVEPPGWVTWSLDCAPTDIDGPPVDGGWSEWGPWACSASCNGGTGTRKRHCDSPRPSIKGEPCIGPSVMTGRCNDIVCGDMTEDTMTLIKRRIRSNHTSIIVHENDPVLIECDRDVIESLKTESPNSEFEWFHNGFRLDATEESESRIDIRDCDIDIKESRVKDSGVYAMNLHRIDESHFILKVITLAVIPSKESALRVRETLRFGLKCHWTILSRVYADLEVSWTIGERVWKRYSIELLLSGTTEIQDEVTSVNRSHHGIWQCIVRQNDLNFQWITNAIQVEVLEAPDWRIYLMEDKATRLIFGWLPSESYVPWYLLFLCVLFFGVLLSLVTLYFRLKRTTLEEQSIETRRLMEDSDVETDTTAKDYTT